MKKTIKLTALSAAILLTAPSAMANFEYSGYLRAGVSTTSSGGEQFCFGDGGYGYYSGRLGNECDSYGEIGLSKNVETEKGQVFAANTMLSVKTDQGAQANDYQSLSEPILSVPQNGSAEIALRQLNVTATGFISPLPEATVWGGKRYYKRKAVEAMDLYYLNNSGYGAGIENVDVSIGDLSFAYVNVQNEQISGKNNVFGKRSVQNNVFDLRLDEIDLFAEQKLDIALVYSQTDPTALQDENNEADDTGFLITTELYGSFFGFDNRLVLQYADDALADAGFGNQSGLQPETVAWWEGTLESSWRVIDFGTYAVTEDIALDYVGYYAQGKTITSDVPETKPSQWSVILTPTYKWDDNNQTKLELSSTSYTSAFQDSALDLQKIMLAHDLSVDVGLTDKLTLRAYTGAFFGKQAEEVRTADRDGEDGNLRFGVQAIASW